MRPRAKENSTLKGGLWRFYDAQDATGRHFSLILGLDRLYENITLNEAVNIRSQLREELKAERGPRERMTLSAYAKQWIEDCASRDRRSTMERKVQIMEQHILPIIGDYYIDSLQGVDLKQWRRQVSRKRKPDGSMYSRETINGWISMLKALIHEAVSDLQLMADPTCTLKPLSVKVEERSPGIIEPNSLSAKEAVKFLQAAKELYSDTHYPMILVGLVTGARFGEYSALTWNDINREAGLIHFNKAHFRGTLGHTKTGYARSAAVDEETLQVLREHRKRLIENQHPGLKAGLVFPSETGGYRHPSCLSKPFKAILKHAQIKRHFTGKGLRRTHINLMRQLQVDRIALRASVGHSSEQMTEHYSFVSPEEKKAAVIKFMGVLKQSPEKKSGEKSGDHSK